MGRARAGPQEKLRGHQIVSQRAQVAGERRRRELTAARVESEADECVELGLRQGHVDAGPHALLRAARIVVEELLRLLDRERMTLGRMTRSRMKQVPPS